MDAYIHTAGTILQCAGATLVYGYVAGLVIPLVRLAWLTLRGNNDAPAGESETEGTRRGA